MGKGVPKTGGGEGPGAESGDRVAALEAERDGLRGELAELHKSEEAYRFLAESAQDFLYLVDSDMRLRFVNRAGATSLGSTPELLRGKHVREIFPETAERQIGNLLKVLDTGEPLFVENPFFVRGREVWLNARLVPVRNEQGEVIAVAGTSLDITQRKQHELELQLARENLEQRVRERTRELEEVNKKLAQEMVERRQLEQRILHTQKLESLGVLAGGLAHDFNNLLMGVLGKADLALMVLPPDSPARADLEDIRSAATRLAELTNQMLAFSGKSRFVIAPFDLPAAVQEMARLVSASISKKIDITLEQAPDTPPIQADASQIRQVILNLLTNAAEAIGEDGGRITVRTGVTRVDHATHLSCFFHDPIPPGEQWVFLEVSDTGEGIREEHLTQVFDPFFTTKFTGRGLGLAAVAGIVRGHRGLIQVTTQPGQGSSFRILIPCASCLVPRDESAPEPHATTPLSKGTIAVAEDDEAAKEVIRCYLEKAGFSVLIASNGLEAVELVRQKAGIIRLVLLDLTMPQMDGIEAAREIRRLQPDLPLILSSGYPEQHTSEKVAGLNLAGFIQKPYVFDTLIDLIHRALADPQKVPHD